MKNLYKGVISLICSALTDKPISLPEDFDWETAVKIGQAHGIPVMLYYGAYNSNIVIPEPINSKLTENIFRLISIDAQQEVAFAEIFDRFEASKIEYMPLKGVILKTLYPKPEMRHMADADILVHIEDYPKIEPIMTELGYTFIVESNHEYVWDKSPIHIELHKLVIPSYNEDYYQYYGTGWQLSDESVGCRHEMRDEDFFIYIFTHLAKHYRDGGIGIKHFTDIWVYKTKKPEMDDAYVARELEKLQLYDFYINCLDLIDVWFGGKEPDEITEFMTEWIFANGAYGSKVNNELAMALKATKKMNSTDNLRVKFWLKELFPGKKLLYTKYPFLNKYPYMMPIMWFVRMLSAILFKRNNVKSSVNKLKNLTNDNVDAYQDLLNYVGLDFNFGDEV